MKLLLATRSTHKAAEIRRILADVEGLQLQDLEDAGIPFDPAEEHIEVYGTFEANAAAKARYFHDLSGLPVVADDSGLIVDALDGDPGVRSKRFAPEGGLEGLDRDLANNEHLVGLLSDVPPHRRTARYACVAVLWGPGGEEATFRGEAEGLIVDAPRGEGGFGYDPHFFDADLERTFAELSAEEKNARSHRGRAFRALADHLASLRGS